LRVSGRAFLLLLCLCCSRGWEVGSLVPVIGANPFWRNSTNAYNATVVRYSTVKQVATGGTHTVLLMTDGTIATYGLNGDGQLCLGDFADRAQPERVRHVQDVHPEFRMLREQFHHDPVLSNTELANVTAVAAGLLVTDSERALG
jgi:alpha-tubulin suppressor-like RCC1 family protein